MEIMLLSPEQYAATPVYDLLRAAAYGYVGADHRWLKAILNRPDEAIQAATRYFKEPDEDAPINLVSDLVAIARELNSPDGLEFWLHFIKEFPEDIPLDAIMAFRKIGAPALEPLLAYYDEHAADEMSEAAFLLASLGIRDERIYNRLVKHLEIDPLEASHCLATYGDAAAVGLLEQAHERALEDWMRQSITSDIERLRDASSQEEGDDTGEDSTIWDEFPDLAAPEFDVIEEDDLPKFLNHPDEEARGAAVRAIGSNPLTPELTAKLFKLAQHDPATGIRAVSWEELGSVVEDDPRVASAMHAVLENESAPLDERAGAMVGLSLSSHDDGLMNRIRQFYDLPETRGRAMQAMIYTRDPQFASLFSKHLDDTDPQVQNYAMQGIGFFEIEKEAHLLERFFDDPDLRLEALQCYALAAPAPLNRSGIVDLYRKIENLAHSLDDEEAQAVRESLNLRLERHDRKPLFNEKGELFPPEIAKAESKAGRNDPCPCGSGKKFKKCCGA